MNETHRGCRSPGGFFFALLFSVLRLLRALVFVVGAVLCWASVNGGLWMPMHGGILWGEALPSIRWFVTMQARGTVARSVTACGVPGFSRQAPPDRFVL
jgi:hypothetical protein